MFWKSNVIELQTKGYYSYIHKGTSPYGEKYEITYVLMFKKIKKADSDFKYEAHTSCETERSLVSKTKLKSDYTEIQNSSFLDTTNGYQCGLCVVDKFFLKFTTGYTDDSTASGQKHHLEGTISKDRLVLDYFIIGFDYSDEKISEKIFTMKHFIFEPFD